MPPRVWYYAMFALELSRPFERYWFTKAFVNNIKKCEYCWPTFWSLLCREESLTVWLLKIYYIRKFWNKIEDI